MEGRKKAFTLIELLVVIAIIGILLSIVIPALRKAKESAQAIICKTNLRGYGTAMKVYLQDNDNFYPESMHTLVNGDATGPGLPSIPLACQWHDMRASPEVNPGFAGHLWPYLETMKSSLCPVFKRFALRYGDQHPNHDTSIPIEPQYAYSQNVFLGRQNDDGSYLAVAQESEVLNPGETLMFVEETIWTIPGYADYVLNDTCFFTRHPNAAFGNLGDFVATYHKTPIEAKDDGVGNSVFVDGHVQYIDPYDSVKTSWGEISGSFRYAWPLKGKFDQVSPYP